MYVIWQHKESNPNTFYLMLFKTVCKARKLDSIYEISMLWGNGKYIVQVLKPGGSTFSPPVEDTVTLKPDTINYFDITF